MNEVTKGQLLQIFALLICGGVIYLSLENI